MPRTATRQPAYPDQQPYVRRRLCKEEDAALEHVCHLEFGHVGPHECCSGERWYLS